MTPLLGLAALTMITAANTFVQLHTEPGMRGRVMALYMMIFIGGTPLGAPLIGWIGEVAGARWTLLVGRRDDRPRRLASSAVYLRAPPTPGRGASGRREEPGSAAGGRLMSPF